MRRRLSIFLLTLVIGLSALSAAPATAGRQHSPLTDDPSSPTRVAQQALARAKRLFGDSGPGPPGTPMPR